ncbi:MAG: hypothetical protein FWH14_08245 [Oscillospiraceae bacterium]|nr:hypothetical protein [Oscillospiraceae bacterium]
MQAPFPSGEGCRRSGGVVCRDELCSSVVTARVDVHINGRQIAAPTVEDCDGNKNNTTE